VRERVGLPLLAPGKRGAERVRARRVLAAAHEEEERGNLFVRGESGGAAEGTEGTDGRAALRARSGGRGGGRGGRDRRVRGPLIEPDERAAWRRGGEKREGRGRGGEGRGGEGRGKGGGE
jgi:hypothetical protein